jgi:hypothetical protein
MPKMYLKIMWTYNRIYKIAQWMTYVKLKVKVKYESDLAIR